METTGNDDGAGTMETLESGPIMNWSHGTGDAQSGLLDIKYDGARPSGYSPMKKEGAVERGTGGDGSAGGVGNFFEGALVAGVPSGAVDDAVQATSSRQARGGSSAEACSA